MAAIEYRGLNAVTNFDLSRYIKRLRPNNKSSKLDTDQSPPPSDHHQHVSDDATLSQPRPAPATSALGLLLQSSKFKEMMDMTLAAECPSTPKSSFPEDIKTYFESNDLCEYNIEERDDIFGDLNSFMEPMLHFESILGEHLVI